MFSQRLGLRLLLVAAAAILLGSISLPGRAQAAQVAPWVHTQGTQFVDQNGQPVLLRGLNVSGSAGPKTAALIASTGADMVRLVVPWSMVEPTAPVGGVHAWDATFLAKVDQQIAWYQAHGINVLVDMHQNHWSPYFAKVGEGIPAWFYSTVRAGVYAKTDAGYQKAAADWWTDSVGQADYTAFARYIVSRYQAYPNVVGYEVFNEPMSGGLGTNHEATQAIIRWHAPIVRAIRSIDPARAVFVQVRGGGNEGMPHADMTPFGSDLSHLVIDYHDYYNGLYGSGWSDDGERWIPSWDATHNQNFLNYHGTEDALMLNLRNVIERTRALGIPVFIGEWGAQTTDSGVLEYQRQMLDVLGRFGLSWTRWDIQGSRFSVASNYVLNAAGLALKDALSPGATPFVSSAPALEVAPSVSGLAQVSQPLQADAGFWSGVPGPTATGFQWQRCDASGASCADIAGATQATYAPVDADLGSTLRVLVSASNGATSSAPSAVTAAVTPYVLRLTGLRATAYKASTSIDFSLNKAASVGITFRNAAGTVVRSLRPVSLPIGPAEIWWNRRDSAGHLLPAGTYTVVVSGVSGSEQDVQQTTTSF